MHNNYFAYFISLASVDVTKVFLSPKSSDSNYYNKCPEIFSIACSN